LAESAQRVTHGLAIRTIMVNHNPGPLLTQQRS